MALFDVDAPAVDALVDTIDITGDLLISNDFALLLIELGLTENDLTGADVGDAWIQGVNQAVPAPGAIAAFMVAGFAGRRRRRS